MTGRLFFSPVLVAVVLIAAVLVLQRVLRKRVRPAVLNTLWLPAAVILAGVIIFTGANSASVHSPDDEGRPLDETMMEQLNGLFFAGSWYSQALTSTYEDPRDVDLGQMFYNGSKNRQITPEEYQYIQQQCGFPGIDVMVISPQEMDEALLEVFGLTLEDTHKVGLDQFLYWEETGCYYLVHGDTNAIGITFTEGQTLGEGCLALTYTGYDGTYLVRLRLGQTESDAGHVYIESHQAIDPAYTS